MRERVVAMVLVGAAAVLGAPSTAFGQAEQKTYVGRAVVDALEELQTSTLKLIFSSELVPPSLRVTKEPKGTDPQKIALQILEPHGLTLREGPSGTLIVVRRRPGAEASKPAATESGPSPPVPTDDERKPLRIEEHVDVVERPDTAEGSRGYSVEPEAVREMAGGLDNVIQSLAVLPGVAAVSDDDGRLAVRGAGPEHNMGGRARLPVDGRGHRSTVSYSDTKLFVTTLAAAVARIWPSVTSNSVDPGWVPTKMGGASAPDDLRLGHLTQEWLATSEDADARSTGGYWRHQRRLRPHPSVADVRFQDDLLDVLCHHTGVALKAAIASSEP